jgi:predicted HAD superfamily Cof-like phosphohydrolase
MGTNFDDVGDFHERFGLDNVTHSRAWPRNPDAELLEFRAKFLAEELGEFVAACTGHDAREVAKIFIDVVDTAFGAVIEIDEAEAFDALIDLAYVTFGTAQLMGFPWQDGWDEVQRANMTKVRALRAEESTRLSTFDVVKPEGWQAPNIASVLRKNGWDV